MTETLGNATPFRKMHPLPGVSSCQGWLAGLLRGYEVSGWWWPVRRWAGQAGEGAVAGRGVVRGGVAPPEVARRLRVSCNSAYVWRRRWRSGGKAALASGGPGGAVCRLGGAQLERLRAALEAGPAVWGWAEDQRWTLERVAALTGRLFHVRYTLRGTSFLLHRMGFSPQVPVHRAAERDEDAIAAWRAVTWAKVRG